MSESIHKMYQIIAMPQNICSGITHFIYLYIFFKVCSKMLRVGTIDEEEYLFDYTLDWN